MKKFKNHPMLARFTGLIILLALAGPVATLCRAQVKSEPPTKTAAATVTTNSTAVKTNAIDSKAVTPETKQTAVKKKLTGAELYSMHCNRCHPERYPTERTAAQWNTIMLHMQIRVNLPGSQARMILKYLQENSGR